MYTYFVMNNFSLKNLTKTLQQETGNCIFAHVKKGCNIVFYITVART